MRLRSFLVVVFLFAAQFPGLTQDESFKDVKGTIRQIDAKAGTVTLQFLSSEKRQAYSLASKEIPVVNPLGTRVQLAMLRADLRVTAKVRNDADVVSLRVEGPYLHGTIKSIDPKTRSITFKDVVAEKTVVIPEEAAITVAGKDGTLARAKKADAIQILLGMDGKTIVRVQIGKGALARDPYLRLTRAVGIIAELDHPKREVRIFAQSTDAGLIKTHEVAADAYLRTMYLAKPVSEVGFERFARWIKVNYLVDRDTDRIIGMDADLPVMTRRKVLEIDGAARRLVVEEEGKKKPLTLSENVKILSPRGERGLADVGPNRIVNCGLSLDRSCVRVLFLWDK